MATLRSGDANSVDNGGAPTGLPGNATAAILQANAASSGPQETGRMFALAISLYTSASGETSSSFNINGGVGGRSTGGIAVIDSQGKHLKALGSTEPRVVAGAAAIAGVDSVGSQISWSEAQSGGSPTLSRAAILYLVLEP